MPLLWCLIQFWLLLVWLIIFVLLNVLREVEQQGPYPTTWGRSNVWFWGFIILKYDNKYSTDEEYTYSNDEYDEKISDNYINNKDTTSNNIKIELKI